MELAGFQVWERRAELPGEPPCGVAKLAVAALALRLADSVPVESSPAGLEELAVRAEACSLVWLRAWLAAVPPASLQV